MPEMMWKTGEFVPESGSWKCESCGNEAQFEANTQFSECPGEHKEVTWIQTSQVGAGAQRQTGQWRDTVEGNQEQWREGSPGTQGQWTGGSQEDREKAA